MWVKVVKAIHVNYGSLFLISHARCASVWLDIINIIRNLHNKGVDLLRYCKKILRNKGGVHCG